ncbi:Protein GLUTELIN PRECURSOR ACCUMULATION 3 [Psilocybe cubensis]|uniref:Galactose oxidase n=2 Tax=Psilocybe cubensis TaxID=181762 RepID=A0A8H8CIF7_PSICU|nr:Protein GLUTELIN PRECURSOR ACCUMULATION 3 [Psilocybe cubensis]KAH9476812.1 Protein GLUTELIN PRECURSOR ACCUMULATION 3 [Psilocybe cubensis]
MDATPTPTTSSSTRCLPNVPEVPEEDPKTASPYSMTSPTSSTTTVNSSSTGKASRKTASVRTLGRTSSEHLTSSSGSSSSTVKRTSSSSTVVPTPSGSGSSRTRGSAAAHARSLIPEPKNRITPKVPHDKDAEPAPSTVMYWSRAPAWGAAPSRTLRAHTATLVDTTAWLVGGCDDKDVLKEKAIYCFDTETMQWSHPETVGDIPPPCRAHTATLCDKKLIIYGGGLGSTYYDAVYVLDTATRRWTRPHIAPGRRPPARRAHSAVYYKGKIWVFGGGTGLTALNDLWTLDISGGAGTQAKPMRWEEIHTNSKRPGPRGYHTANLVGNIMVIIGGSDGKESFTEVWCLNLDTLVWSAVKQQTSFHKRLAHSATQVGSYIFIVGGHGATDYVSDLLMYNLVSLQYEDRVVLGKPPSIRGYHATILADSRLFVFGGFNGATAFDDVHILDLAAGAYLPQVTSFTMEETI